MNKRLNSKQQEELVKNNLKLVYYLANKFQTPLDDNYEDLISIGTIGLIKASQTFDESKEIKFVTYAACCIKNEFYMYYRKEKTHINAVSLDEPINVDNYGPEMTIGDKIMIDEEDFTKQIEQNEICARTLSILLNALPLRDKLLMLYKISGNTQQFISKKLNISQSYISRLEQKSITKIKLYMNNSRAFEEVYSVKIQDHLCQISFSINDVMQFEKTLLTLRSKFPLNQFPENFKINCLKKRIILTIPTHPEYFYFIALFLQEFEDFQ